MNAITTPVSFPENSTTVRLRPVPAPAWLRTGMKAVSAVAPDLAAKLAHRLFFTPIRARVRDEERAVLARGEAFTLGPEGERVVGRVWGEGPAVLLVHGWGGHSGQMTALVEPLVAAGCRAVALDLPGHGASDGRVSSLVHGARALKRVAALFGPFEGLIAHSFGAAVSTYAITQGLPVRRAVYFAPPSRFETFWLRFRMGVGVSAAVMERMLRRAEEWLHVKFDGLSPVDMAPRMDTPLLILHDPGDREMPFSEGTELARTWPGAVLQRADGLGHLRLLRDPGCVAGAVAFLREE
jgi:pimeloyl-ACP methyl ester carboxylesterase